MTNMTLHYWLVPPAQLEGIVSVHCTDIARTRVAPELLSAYLRALESPPVKPHFDPYAEESPSLSF